MFFKISLVEQQIGISQLFFQTMGAYFEQTQKQINSTAQGNQELAGGRWIRSPLDLVVNEYPNAVYVVKSI